MQEGSVPTKVLHWKHYAITFPLTRTRGVQLEMSLCKYLAAGDRKEFEEAFD